MLATITISSSNKIEGRAQNTLELLMSVYKQVLVRISKEIEFAAHSLKNS